MIPFKIDRALNQFRFDAFPNTPLNYVSAPPNAPGFVRFQVDSGEKTTFIFVNLFEMQKVGISSTIFKRCLKRPDKLPVLFEHATRIDGLLKKAGTVAASHFSQQTASCLTQNTALVSRMICRMINDRVKVSRHLKGFKEIPEMYFQPKKSSIGEIFIDVTVSSYLGIGGVGFVEKAIRVTAPSERDMLVAKKVFDAEIMKKSQGPFVNELRALQQFSQKRGIISLITGGLFGDQYVLFLPLYECSFWDYYRDGFAFQLSWDEALSVTEQWLQGLVTISKHGIHGDISFKNLLMRKKGGAVEGVISDFGSFRPHSKKDRGGTTITYAPPEYFSKQMVTSKNDVWALGLALRALCSDRPLPCHDYSTGEMAMWTSQLSPGWFSAYSIVPKTPPFLVDVIRGMLDPAPESRWTALEALERFSKGYASFKETSSSKKRKSYT